MADKPDDTIALEEALENSRTQEVEPPKQSTLDKINETFDYSKDRRIKDKQWANDAYAITNPVTNKHARQTDRDTLANLKKLRLATSVRFKKSSTKLGHHFAVNMPPGFTPTADVPFGGDVLGSTDKPIGRYYSEAIDDNAQLIHLRFGLPKHNPLDEFIKNMYHTETAKLANKDEGRGLANSAGLLLGTVLGLPFRMVHMLTFGAFDKLSEIVSFAQQADTSRYYYSRPAMEMYWGMVNRTINQLAMELNLIPDVDGGREEAMLEASKKQKPAEDSTGEGYDVVGEQSTSAAQLKAFKGMYPVSWIDDNGGIDVYSFATRANRLQNAQDSSIRKSVMNTEDGALTQAKLDNIYEQANKLTDEDALASSYQVLLERKANHEQLIQSARSNNKSDGILDTVAGWFDALGADVVAEMEDGSQWLTLKVNPTGTSSESFSSSHKESGLQASLNSRSKAASDAKFSFGGGNLSDDSGFGSIIEGIVGQTVEAMKGMAEGLGIAGVGMVDGSAQVDIPKIWESSTAELPTMSYTMPLRTQSAHPISIMQNLYIPMWCLLCGGIPRSTGANTYTAPFTVEVISKGRAICRVGQISSIGIERGVGNLGWGNGDLPLGIDLNFTITDMSDMIHMPIGGRPELYGNNTSLDDYLATLAGVGMSEMTQPAKILARKLAIAENWLLGFQKPSKYASMFRGTGTGSLLSVLAKATDR